MSNEARLGPTLFHGPLGFHWEMDVTVIGPSIKQMPLHAAQVLLEPQRLVVSWFFTGSWEYSFSDVGLTVSESSEDVVLCSYCVYVPDHAPCPACCSASTSSFPQSPALLLHYM